MSVPPEPPPTIGSRIPWLRILAAVVFAISYTQSPLYYSNQNQYFLHALAEAGVGDLSSDWLANTRDPTPLFSRTACLTYQVAGEWPFQVVYFVLLMAYFLALCCIAQALPFFPRFAQGELTFAAGMIVVHSGIVRVMSVQLFGVDYPWYLQAGVANQYLLGPGLQPSAFGVLLLIALAAFVSGRPVLGGFLAAATCGLHSTYLLPAGLLVAGMMLALVNTGRTRMAVLTGTVALVGVAPVLAYNLRTFAPTSAAEFADAQRILAEVRIPHHAVVARWFDGIAGLQIAWLMVGMMAFRRTTLFPVMAVMAGGGFVLTLAQVATRNPTLALVFPWRESTVLVPMATAAACAGLARFAELRLPINVGILLGFAAILVSVAGAGWVYSERLGYQVSVAEDGLMNFVRTTRQSGALYLLPAGFPKPATSRGVGSSTFVPVPPTDRPAVFELQRFRLGTGAAVFVDFKSVPYHDAEVREWLRRVEQVVEWYGQPDWDASGTVDAVRAIGITHVVVPAGVTIHSTRLKPVYHDAGYRVFRVRQ